MLKNYNEFINYINQYKIVPFSKILDGFPSISELTSNAQWHTGKDISDPWRWKDIAAENKDCAYGCLLGGKKVFVSMGTLPIFHAAYTPDRSIDELYYEGKLSKISYDAYSIINSMHSIAIFDLRSQLGVTKKKGASALDNALKQLQQMMKVSISGSRQKINKQGIPYGWRSNVYTTFEKWAGMVIIEDAKNYDKDEAQNIISDIICDNFDIDERILKKLFKL